MTNPLYKHIRILQELGYGHIFVENAMGSAKEKEKQLKEIDEEIQQCQKCDLYKSRKQAVLGEGNPDSPLVFIGEAPGGDEDKLGRPFVGRAGKLLSKLIEATGHKRKEFYITNICKCRPPNNRTPTPWEMEACFPYLEQQLQIIKPKVLCLLGATAARAFLKRNVAITKERGSIINWNDKLLYLTYHPAYVLRNPNAESILFKDIQKAINLAIEK